LDFICLDTNVVIEYLKNKKSASAQFILSARNKVKLCITSINLYELFFGPMYAGYDQEIEDIKSFILWVRVLPFDERAAEIAANIDSTLHKKGKRIDLRDIFIAATCIVFDAKIITYNVSHFKVISSETEYELIVMTPTEALKEYNKL